MRKHTDMLELVETHNLALSLKRMMAGDGMRLSYDAGMRARRSLYHAILIADLGGSNMKTALRAALELP